MPYIVSQEDAERTLFSVLDRCPMPSLGEPESGRAKAEEAFNKLVGDGVTVESDGFAETYVPDNQTREYYQAMLSGVSLAINWMKTCDLGEDAMLALKNLEEVQILTASRYLDTPPSR